MRQMILTGFLMIAAGVFGFVEGRDWTQARNLVAFDFVESEQPHVVLAKSATRQQKEARQQSEGCPVIPNGELSQQKGSEEEHSIMKGLVF